MERFDAATIDAGCDGTGGWTCRPFDAEEARAAGFVNRVVPEERLDDEVASRVAQLEAKSSSTLRATKRHTNVVAEGMVATARACNDADSLMVALHDPESRAAADAYLERVRAR